MYTLYFAPDNASLIVRIVLEELGVAYNTWLVDRPAREQDSEAYRKLNPNGLIPVCIIDGEPVFETAEIILSLADRHRALAPPVDDAASSRMATALQQRPTVIRSFEAEGIPAPFLLGARYPDGSRGAAL